MGLITTGTVIFLGSVTSPDGISDPRLQKDQPVSIIAHFMNTDKFDTNPNPQIGEHNVITGFEITIGDNNPIIINSALNMPYGQIVLFDNFPSRDGAGFELYDHDGIVVKNLPDNLNFEAVFPSFIKFNPGGQDVIFDDTITNNINTKTLNKFDLKGFEFSFNDDEFVVGGLFNKIAVIPSQSAMMTVIPALALAARRRRDQSNEFSPNNHS